MLRLLRGGTRLIAGLTRAAVSLRRDRSRAQRDFRRALLEMGLPEDAASELAEAYPKLELPRFARREG